MKLKHLALAAVIGGAVIATSIAVGLAWVISEHDLDWEPFDDEWDDDWESDLAWLDAELAFGEWIDPT